MISNDKISEIKQRCYKFLINLTDDSDTDDFLQWTATLNDKEMKFCGGVFMLYERYLQKKVSEKESKLEYAEFIKDFTKNKTIF